MTAAAHCLDPVTIGNVSMRYTDGLSSETTYPTPLSLHFDVATDPHCDWEYEADYLMTYPSIGNLIIPFVWDKEIHIHCPNIGDVYMQDNVAETVTRHEVEHFSLHGIPQRSPTLFISIGGANFYTDPDGNRIHEWQEGNYIGKVITLFMSQAQAEFHYMMVDWNSLRPNGEQSRRLAKIVRYFLDSRIQPWDIVIIGHSRGGIFAHDLSEDLSYNQHRNQRKLYTLLIDPTAALLLGDHFPNGKPSGVTLAKNYYDNRPLIDSNVNQLLFNVIDDRDIPNYDVNFFYRQEIDHLSDLESHSGIIFDYVRRQFTQDLLDVLNRKDPPRDYPQEGCRCEVVKIGDPKTLFSSNLQVEVGPFGFHMEGELGIDRLQASFDVHADSSRLSASVASALVAGSISFTHEGMSAYGSVAQVGSIGATIDEEGLDVNYDTFGHSTQVVIEEDEVAITVTAGADSSIEVSTSGAEIKLGGVTIVKW